MANKKYSDELKLQVVQEYLAGKSPTELARKYGIRDTKRISFWKKQYITYGSFPDGRGKGSPGRPRKIDTSQMTKDEYIAFLEMENDILKQLSSLNRNHVKKNIK